MLSPVRPLALAAALAALGCLSAGGQNGDAGALDRPAPPSAVVDDEASDEDGDDGDGKSRELEAPEDCDEGPCVYHAGADRYRACSHAAQGECFRFGATCEPEDRCMFDGELRAYRACERASAGRCAEFGTPCAPSDRCMFDPESRRYRHCEQTDDDGACVGYGAACMPAGKSGS